MRGHIIPGKGDEEHVQNRVGMVTNPTVHIAMNQIRHVVNEIIGSYGRPYSIAIELGRELPVGAKGRKELDRQQAENQQMNDRLDGLLIEQKQTPNRNNRLRLRLWEELAQKPLERFCPFSGPRIGITDLFNGQHVQIDHLIPFSVSLDDTSANKEARNSATSRWTIFSPSSSAYPGLHCRAHSSTTCVGATSRS